MADIAKDLRVTETTLGDVQHVRLLDGAYNLFGAESNPFTVKSEALSAIEIAMDDLRQRFSDYIDKWERELPDNMGNIPYSFIGANTVNNNIVKGSPGRLYGVQAFNIAATPVYVKFYDTGSVADVTTMAPVKRLAIPGNTAAAGFVVEWERGVVFKRGIVVRMVTGITDSDATAPTANEQLVNIDYR